MFPVKFVKFIRTPVLRNICERLLLNLGQNISRLFHVLVQFQIVISEREHEYYHQKDRKGMYELPHDLTNDFRKFGNFKHSA